MEPDTAPFLLRRLRERGRELSEREYSSKLVPCSISLAHILDAQEGVLVTVAAARSVHSEVAEHVVPDLFEPQLVALTAKGFRLDGYESCIDPSDGTLVRWPQSWHVWFRR
jgi:hypothetical protein